MSDNYGRAAIEQLSDMAHSIKSFGAHSITEAGYETFDSTKAIQDAVDKLGVAKVTEGIFDFNATQLKGNLLIEGVGEGSILRQKAGVPAYQALFQANSNGASSIDVAENMRNIVIRDLRIEGNVATEGYLEGLHLIDLNAVSDVVIERVRFVGFRCDGLFIGSSHTNNVVMHNEDIVVRDCTFDGVNNDNRNGISVIDGTDVLIENCKFVNCTKSNMPGAIDIEPNPVNYNIVRDIAVRNNTFKHCGGNSGVITFDCPMGQKELLTPVFDITFEDNHIDTTEDTQAGIRFTQRNSDGTAITDTTPPIHGRIINNTITNCAGYPVVINGVRDVLFKDNTLVENAYSGMYIGDPATNGTVKDLQITHNTFYHNGTVAESAGIEMYNVDRATIEGNTFDDNGMSSEIDGYAIRFGGWGYTSNIKLLNNEIIKGTRQLLAYFVSGDHVLAPAGNVCKGNKLYGYSYSVPTRNQFKAYVTDDGSIMDAFNTTILPDAFPVGESVAILSGADTTTPNTSHKGMLVTKKFSPLASHRGSIVQILYPDQSDSITIHYERKATAASNTWQAWKTFTGA